MSGDSAGTRTRTRIPVTLVTGFLGSGKTTFINAALRSPELAKTIVVVNEFGEVGLDHQLFASSVRLGRRARERLPLLHGQKRPRRNAEFAVPRAAGGEIPIFDNVVIETSGLAEPGAVLQAFLSEPTLDGLYRSPAWSTLVDAVNWRGTAETA